MLRRPSSLDPSLPPPLLPSSLHSAPPSPPLPLPLTLYLHPWRQTCCFFSFPACQFSGTLLLFIPPSLTFPHMSAPFLSLSFHFPPALLLFLLPLFDICPSYYCFSFYPCIVPLGKQVLFIPPLYLPPGVLLIFSHYCLNFQSCSHTCFQTCIGCVAADLMPNRTHI